MTEDEPALTETIVRRLYELACTPFTLATFRDRWREYGWSPDSPADSDPYGFHVPLPEGWFLGVDPIGADPISVMLPIYYWEDFSPKFFKGAEEYQRQKAAFHARFDPAANLAIQVLSQPFFQWTDTDEQAHRAVAWEGSHGILIFQEACAPPQGVTPLATGLRTIRHISSW